MDSTQSKLLALVGAPAWVMLLLSLGPVDWWVGGSVAVNLRVMETCEAQACRFQSIAALVGEGALWTRLCALAWAAGASVLAVALLVFASRIAFKREPGWSYVLLGVFSLFGMIFALGAIVTQPGGQAWAIHWGASLFFAGALLILAVSVYAQWQKRKA